MTKSPKMVLAGKKSWETRRSNIEKHRRSEIAKRAASTRRSNADQVASLPTPVNPDPAIEMSEVGALVELRDMAQDVVNRVNARLRAIGDRLRTNDPGALNPRP